MRIGLRLDLSDHPFCGTVLAGEPAPFHFRLGRDRRVRLDARWGWWWVGRVWCRSSRPSSGWLGVLGRWATDASIVLGPLIIRTWRVERPAPAEVARAVAEWEAAEVTGWAEAQGVILCRPCRRQRRRACAHPASPLCERSP